MEEYIPILIGIYQSLPTAGKMQFIACAGNLRDEYKNVSRQSGKVIQFPTDQVKRPLPSTPATAKG